MNNRLYMGFDPGYNFGVAVINPKLNTIVYFCTIDCREERETLTGGVNFCKLEEKLLKLLLQYRPKCVTIEDSTAISQFCKEAVQSLTGTKVAAMMACMQYNEKHNLTLVLRPPTSIKADVTGKGNATKVEVRDWVNRRFKTNFDKTKDNHVTDAVSIAYLGYLYEESQQCRTNIKQSKSKKAKS